MEKVEKIKKREALEDLLRNDRKESICPYSRRGWKGLFA